MQKFYIDASGNQYSLDGVAPDPSWTEVPTPRPNVGWVWNGSTWLAPPPTVPAAITPLQARKALRAAGLYSAVQNYVASLPEEAREEWEYATQIERNNTIIAGGAAALGMSSEQVDQLFIMGAGL